MESKLAELTNKIYSEGIERGNKEAADIVEKAKREAEEILQRAKNEALDVVNTAKKESEQLKNKVNQELKMASNQSVVTLKQEIANIISNKVLNEGIKSGMSDTDFIKKLITEVIAKWSSESKSLDLELVLSEKNKKELSDFFKSKAAEALSKGIEINFDSRMDNGFKIGPKDKSFILSFTDKDFIQFFQSFLKPKTKEILFTEN